MGVVVHTGLNFAIEIARKRKHNPQISQITQNFDKESGSIHIGLANPVCRICVYLRRMNSLSPLFAQIRHGARKTFDPVLRQAHVAGFGADADADP